jgi:hypothetical protein
VSCSDKEVIAVACASDVAGQIRICSPVVPIAVASRKPARRRMLMGRNRMPLALGPAEGEALWFGRTLTMVKVAAEQTAGAYSIIEDVALKGEGTPLHRHQEDDEAFFVHIPGGTVHAFRVDSETARYLIITTPQHERFYRAITEPAQTWGIPPESPIDMEKIGAACEAYAVEDVGPMPEA